MRVLTITPYFESHRGGVEIVAGQIARELAARGLEVRWLASDESPPPEPRDAAQVSAVAFEAVNLTERRYGVPFPLPPTQALRRIAREVAECDIVLAHDVLYMTTLIAYVAARFLHKRIIVVQHIGHVPYRHWAARLTLALADRFLARPVLEGVDQVVFISESTQRHFRGVRLRAPARLLRNGVDTAIFHGPRRRRDRAAFGLSAEPAILFVGRFIEKKGLHLLARLARRRGDLQFVFAGWGEGSPSAWGLANVSVFSGLAGASLARLYRACDALVLPSCGEGFPLVVQEALACGLPVVCGAETAAGDGRAADWVRAVDLGGGGAAAVERLSAALDQTLASDCPAKAAGRARFARERYSWRVAGEAYRALIGEVLAADTRPTPSARPARRRPAPLALPIS